MVDILSKIRIEDDEIEKMDSLPYNLWMFASVCLKVSEEEDKLSSSSSCAAGGAIINIPMSEKKPLPFNLNVKPRTYRRPRSKPIDARALFPCLYKRKLDSPVDSNQDGLSQVPKKRRLVIRFKVFSSENPNAEEIFLSSMSDMLDCILSTWMEVLRSIFSSQLMCATSMLEDEAGSPVLLKVFKYSTAPRTSAINDEASNSNSLS